MADIVTLRAHLGRRDSSPSTHWDGCITAHPICALAWALDEIERLRKEVDLKGYRLDDALDEIERLRALCNDLYHDATCAESFCRLCGEGIREWEARRG